MFKRWWPWGLNFTRAAKREAQKMNSKAERDITALQAAFIYLWHLWCIVIILDLLCTCACVCPQTIREAQSLEMQYVGLGDGLFHCCCCFFMIKAHIALIQDALFFSPFKPWLCCFVHKEWKCCCSWMCKGMKAESLSGCNDADRTRPTGQMS